MAAALVVIAFASLACAFVAAILLIRRTTISVVITEYADMATIKDRLAALEKDNADLRAQLSTHSDTLTGVATTDAVDALTGRVGAIESEIGSDPAPEEAPAPLAQADEQPLG